jgi:hypothetical protein
VCAGTIRGATGAAKDAADGLRSAITRIGRQSAPVVGRRSTVRMRRIEAVEVRASGLPAGAKSAEAAHEPRPRLRPGQVQSRCDR